jgi:pimeloyl-ACP methyl ester carboxylesterase
MRMNVVIAGVLATLLASCTDAGPSNPSPAASGARPASSLHVEACPGERAVRCGSIRVPLYWARSPDPATDLTVAFRIYGHTDRSKPPSEPIVAFEGGPGYGSIHSSSSYLFMLGPLHRRHDLIVMDQRGTGASGAIDCPALQRGAGNYVDLVAACARQLGDAANAYGSAAASDDLHAILQGLGIPEVDVYGDSYGTYLAQVFALHHPDDVRAMVLDGTFDQSFDPFARDASAALRRAWTVLCARAGTCPGILAAIGRTARRLSTHPLTGVVPGANGAHRVRLTSNGFAQMVYDATYVFTIYRDLPAAMRSLERGDRAPLLRLASEDLGSTGNGGNPEAYSAGLYMAVSCHDYPTIWDPAAPVPRRRDQLRKAIAGLAPDAFAPFGVDAWLGSLYEHQLVYGCLRWPAPTVPDPAFLRTITRSQVPVLVMDGELDVTTPLIDARRTARAWPNATLVEVRNELHISALYDYQACASLITRRFLQTLHVGDNSCVSHIPDVQVMPSFPLRLADAPQSTVVSRSTRDDRCAIWVASQTVGDAFARWYNVFQSGTGDALRGGTYVARGPYLSHRPLTIGFHKARLVEDLQVSGRATWDRRANLVTARLHVGGAASGDLTIRFPTRGTDATATIHGVLGGQVVRATMPAPWAP